MSVCYDSTYTIEAATKAKSVSSIVRAPLKSVHISHIYAHTHYGMRSVNLFYKIRQEKRREMKMK